MRRVFVPEGAVSGEIVTLRAAEAHYLRRVLRMAPGDSFAAVLPGGAERIAMVESIDAERVVATLGPPVGRDADPGVEVRVYLGLTKSGKPELVVQKCTELGITSVHPVLCRRSVSRPSGGRAAGKVERWQRIADEAARQSGRKYPALVAPVIGFGEAVEEIAASGGAGLLLTPEAEASGLEQLALTTPVSLLIGPEGGFDGDEVDRARGAGLELVSVGERVLRAETAAIAVSAIVMHLLGEMGRRLPTVDSP